MGATDADRVVTVFGSGEAAPGGDEWRVALAVGRALGELGYSIANGGYGGTMAASAEGARRAGAEVTGVTCRVWKSPPNPHVTRTVVTDDLPGRIETLIDLGRAGYVVLPGATGTLAELAWVWELTFKKFLPRRPIVCVGDFWRPLIDLMALARPGGPALVAVAAGADELARHFPAR
jgi:hypothetical protein